MPSACSSLGQFFTPPHIVETMWALKRRRGRILEPSCGDGAFLQSPSAQSLSVTALDIDSSLNTPKGTLITDFFDYPVSEKFDTIIGNPPYVRFQDITPSTLQKISSFLISLSHPSLRFDNRSNLYLFFIYKATLHLQDKGELIFITPRDFIKSTSAKYLNEYLARTGSITHFHDYGDTKIFNNATPNCAIWRFEKGRANTEMQDGREFLCRKGQLYFLESQGKKDMARCIGDSFEVKVGAVSGADHIYASDRHGERSFVCSQTRSTDKLRRMIYGKNLRALRTFKADLLARRIRKFDESNWWEWGRGYPERTGERIYVNGKTRVEKPFFVSEEPAFDGSVLALFPKKETCDLAKACSELNLVDWRTLGFMTGGRYIFSQRSLENAVL